MTKQLVNYESVKESAMEATLFEYEMGLARGNLEQLTGLADHVIDLLRGRTESDPDEPPPAEQAAQLLDAADNFLFAAKVLRRQVELPPVTTNMGAIAQWLSDNGFDYAYERCDLRDLGIDHADDPGGFVIMYNDGCNAIFITTGDDGEIEVIDWGSTWDRMDEQPEQPAPFGSPEFYPSLQAVLIGLIRGTQN
jgi:hypothetical protein